MLEVLTELDTLLKNHYSTATPYLCGEKYTLADGAPVITIQTPDTQGSDLGAAAAAQVSHRILVLCSSSLHCAPASAVFATCVLARSFWTEDGEAHIRAHPKLNAYFDRMRRRPSFDKAQVWTGLRPGRVFCVLGDVFSGAFRSVGSFLNETVVHPVQQTPGARRRCAFSLPTIILSRIPLLRCSAQARSISAGL